MSSAALFERIAPRYDELWTNSAIGRAQRNAVWRVVDPLFRAGDCVLDIGCGTGEDAAHLMACGVRVQAIDASPAMVALAAARGIDARVMRAEDLAQSSGADPVACTGRPRPGFEQADQGGGRRPGGLPHIGADFDSPKPMFDGALSNFGALNCVADLAPVARALGALVRPGGNAAICMIGRFCAWETLYPRKAFRRWPGHAGDIYYPTVRQLRAVFAPEFDLLHWHGIGMLVPPSYVRLPARVVNALARIDRLPVLRWCADHRLLVFRRK